MDLEEIADRIFNPMFIACMNFTAFGIAFFLGISGTNQALTYTGFGFFIAGSCIGVMTLTDKWMNGDKIVEQAYTIKGGVPNGMQAGKNKVLTAIEM